MNKSFLVILKIVIGNYEKSSKKIVEASTDDEARKTALWGECHFEPREDDYENDGVYDCHGEWHYSVASCVEIAPEHTEILRSYLHPSGASDE